MRILLTLMIVALCLPLSISFAQDTTHNDLRVVYVTTQDNASLRAGPGRNWERLAVVPFSTTLRATGRTLDARWIQVAYEGARISDAYPEATIDGVTYGWIAAELLIWTGSILELPVDGVHTVNFARSAGTIILITPDDQIYTGLVGPVAPVPYPLEGSAYVEATGRLGGGINQYSWVQFKANGKFYWVSALGVPMSALPDARYLYSLGRLNLTVTRNYSRLNGVTRLIGDRWQALSEGQATTCNDLPEPAALFEFSQADISREPVFAALANAFREAKAASDRAVARFHEVCATPTVPVTRENVNAALADVAEARRWINVVGVLLVPIGELDPNTFGGFA